MESLEEGFYKICYECLYYGYFKDFIFEQYKYIVYALGMKKANNIYKRAFDKITSE